jgi:hypothetical protein
MRVFGQAKGHLEPQEIWVVFPELDRFAGQRECRFVLSFVGRGEKTTHLGRSLGDLRPAGSTGSPGRACRTLRHARLTCPLPGRYIGPWDRGIVACLPEPVKGKMWSRAIHLLLETMRTSRSI